MIVNIIGFTGSQNGLREDQRYVLIRTLRYLEFSEFHHGDCIGADDDAHTFFHLVNEIHNKNVKFVIHPPDNPSKRAFREGDLILPAKPYLERNKDIVDASDLLIACPSGDEVIRSGTWSTVRYARKMNKTIFVIMPNGLLTVEVS